MSITSSNNLAVNNSLTVNSNTILGVDNTSTLICNSKPTFNSDMTISGNINQTGTNTFSSGSGNITLNGNVIINPTKSLTCSSINNSGNLSTGVIEIYNASFPYIDMKSVNSDYDIRFGCTGGSSGTSGQGTLTINHQIQ